MRLDPFKPWKEFLDVIFFTIQLVNIKSKLFPYHNGLCSPHEKENGFPWQYPLIKINSHKSNFFVFELKEEKPSRKRSLTLQRGNTLNSSSKLNNPFTGKATLFKIINKQTMISSNPLASGIVLVFEVRLCVYLLNIGNYFRFQALLPNFNYGIVLKSYSWEGVLWPISSCSIFCK